MSHDLSILLLICKNPKKRHHQSMEINSKHKRKLIGTGMMGYS